MNDPAQVHAYATADFEQPHSMFIDQLQTRYGANIRGRALDLGCGPGDITLRFLHAFPACDIDAVDGAANMLAYARKASLELGLQDRLRLIECRLPEMLVPEASYPLIISNSLLHHLDEPMHLWQAIRQYTRPGSIIFIMDLLRPASEQAAHDLVQRYAAEEADILQQDFYHSLLAAYRPDEIGKQLQRAGLSLQVAVISDRHLLIHGVLS